MRVCESCQRDVEGGEPRVLDILSIDDCRGVELGDALQGSCLLLWRSTEQSALRSSGSGEVGNLGFVCGAGTDSGGG